MKKSFLGALALIMAISHARVASANLVEEFLGGVIGGGLSALLCRELGANRDVTVACAIGGAVLGANVARKMSAEDARAYAEAQQRAFDGDVNEECRWDGRQYRSRTGMNGRIRTIDRGYNRSTREECRTFRTVTYQGHQMEQEQTSIICRRSDGSFYSLEQTRLYERGRLVSEQRDERRGRVNPPEPVRPPPVVPAPRPIPGESRYCQGWMINQVNYGDLVYDARGFAYTFRGYDPRSGNVRVTDPRGYVRDLNVGWVALSGCHYGYREGDYVSTARGDGPVVAVYRNGDLLVQFGRIVDRVRSNEIYR
ncbi:MAG: hypothetical protein ACK5Y2_06105 [Bdellovibrionales bacterium]